MNVLFTPPPPSYGLIGHRGAASLAPENTLAGFTIAKKIGLNWVEFDIQLTKDGEWVLFHDDELPRTSTGQGAIYEHPLSQLKSLDAGSWFAENYHGLTIPTLSETLTCLDQLGLFPNIEVKAVPHNPYSAKELGEALIQCLKAQWPSTELLPLISSFDHTILHWIRQHAPQYPLGFLFDGIENAALDKLLLLDNVSLHFSQPRSQQAWHLVESISAKKPVILYTINDEKSLQLLRSAGCFACFTDCPQKFIPELC